MADISGSGQSGAPTGLPKTIEEATRRYLYHYHNNYNGPASDMVRLKGMIHAFIYRLRRIAPRFYEEKLPTFVNQACSTLLLIDTKTKLGADEFHNLNAKFLAILDEFKRSQPAGDVNFYEEKRRWECKRELVGKQLELKKLMNELDAVEIDADELGEEDDLTSNYAKLMAKREAAIRDLAAVSMELVMLEGMDTEEEVKFELRVNPRSILNKLTKEELEKLETLMYEFRVAHKDRTDRFCDISVIEGMFDQLNIAPDRFQKEQLKAMRKDALDAYRSYFREIDREVRENYFESLLRSNHLLPREGALIDPDDLPEDVRARLDENDQRGQQEFDQIVDSFGAAVCNERDAGDAIDDSGDEQLDDKVIVLERLRQRGIKVERVKEEPRDDCDPLENQLEEDFEVDSDTAEALVDNRLVANADEDASYYDEADQEYDGRPRKILKKEGETSDGQQTSDERSDVYEDAEDDDDIECLGTVEPADKIPMYQLTEE